MINYLAHLFLPRPSNNHKAKLLHPSTLVILIFTISFFPALMGRITSRGGEVLGYAANISPSEVIRLTNEKRAQAGLASLTENPVLSRAALSKGADMLSKGYWAHVAPDGTQPWAFFAAVSYNYRYAGENLARDFSNPSSAVEAWMASPTHRENMLSSHYKEIGIGVVEGNLAGADTTIIVQFFGTRVGDTLPTQPIAAIKTANPTAEPTQVPIVVQITPVPATPTPTATAVVAAQNTSLVASSQVTPFNVTRYLSFGVVGILIVVVAVDGFIVNRRKIFRIAGHYPAHFAFLGMILIIVIIAKAGRVI